MPSAVLGPHAALEVRVEVGEIRDFIEKVVKVRKELGFPVQALRADRVVSEVHVRMAVEHARRSTAGGTARADDPAVEFLLYAAADRQIHRAVDALGVRPDATQDVVFVALGATPEERLGAALETAGLAAYGPFVREMPKADTTAWWAARLGLPAGAGPRMVEDRLLAVMALLALDRA